MELVSPAPCQLSMSHTDKDWRNRRNRLTKKNLERRKKQKEGEWICSPWQVAEGLQELQERHRGVGDQELRWHGRWLFWPSWASSYHGHYHGHHRGCHDHDCHHYYRQASLIIVITTRRLRGFGRRSWLGKHMVSLAFSTLTPSTSTSLTSTSTLLTSTSTLYYSILSINAKQAKKTFWLHGDSIMFMFLHNVNNDLHSTQITSILHQHNHCIFITNISIVIMIKCSTGKDCFIIPQANLDRFLPDGVTVSCL